MPPHSAYAGGYSENVRRQLEKVVIPDKVKCATCKKVRMQTAFSKRQLDYLRNEMVIQGTKALSGNGIAKCRTCVGGQTVELKCCICDKIKGLDEFAKSQRQDRDFARCLNCVQSHAEADPVLDEQKLLMEGEFSTIEDTLTTADEGSSTHPSKRYKNPTPHYSRDNSSDDDDDDDFSLGGGVWLETHRTDEHSTSRGKERVYNAFDPNGIAHLRVSEQPSSPKSIHSGWASMGISPKSVPPPKKKVSKFAKVPGYRFEKNEAPTMRVPEPTTETIPSDNEDDDEGVEDYL